MTKKKKRILIVDDSSTVILMERMVLGDLGYELSVARSGEEALEKAATEKPDLVLMDVVMPGMSGFDAVKALRARDATRTTPIIMVTTRSEPQYVEEGYKSGCNDYIIKPFDKKDLLAKLKTHLGEGA